jgi:DNA-binding FadR family transcriptional regulator
MCDFEESTTWQQDLRDQLSSAQIELVQLRLSVLSLRYSSDADAARLLARLRTGEDIAQLATAEPVHRKRYARFTNVCQFRAVKLTADKGFQSQNMLMVPNHPHNIP